MLAALLQAGAHAQTGPEPACTITGTARAGHTPLPGVVLSVTSAENQTVDLGSSGHDGSYAMKVPGPGHYTLKGELLAFAPISREFVVDEATCQLRIDLEMALASRAPMPTAPAAGPVPLHHAASLQASSHPLRSGQRLQPFQGLALLLDHAGLAREDAGWTATESAAQPLLPPGFSPETSSESVTTLGSAQAASESFSGPGADGLQRLKNQFGEGRDQLRGSLSQSFATSGLDSAPFPINGRATQKPNYFQQHFAATIGGPFAIPIPMGVSAPTFFFFNYNGTRQSSPYDRYSSVPTQAERAGDLATLPTVVFDPTTRQPFPGGQIRGPRIDPAARWLLNLFSLPNQSGTKQNFHIVSTNGDQVDGINLRVVHNFTSVRSTDRGGGADHTGGGRGGGRHGARTSTSASPIGIRIVPCRFRFQRWVAHRDLMRGTCRSDTHPSRTGSSTRSAFSYVASIARS